MGIEQYKGKQMSNKTETELSLASDAEVRKWDERDRADEEYFMMLEKAAIMRESVDEQLRAKKPWSERLEKDWRERGGYIYKNSKAEIVVLKGNTVRVLESK